MSPAQQGYGGIPGTGPAGETCRSCRYRIDKPNGVRTFFKCELARERWGHSRHSDIVLSSPACEFWEPRDASKNI